MNEMNLQPCPFCDEDEHLKVMCGGGVCPHCGESTIYNKFYDITIPVNPELSVTESLIQLLTENEIVQEDLHGSDHWISPGLH